MPPAFSNRASPHSYKLLLTSSWLLIALGIVLRCVLRNPISLWEDEIIAASHAKLSLLRTVLDSFLGDMHPPLYFIELHVWMLMGHSDAWLVTNSVLLSLLAVGSLYLVIRKLQGPQLALATAAIYAVLPVTIWMAEEVRMYAMLSILLAWFYYFVVRAYAAPGARRNTKLAVFALAVAIIYTHAIGFVAVFIFGLYGACLLALRRAPRRDWFGWLAVFGIAAVTAAPILVSSILIKADMAPMAHFTDIFSWMASLVVGNGYRGMSWLEPAGLAAFALIAIPGLILPRTRYVTLCFLIGPLVLCAIMEVALKPLFKTNFFPNLCAPFFAIVIGQLLLAPRMHTVLRGTLILGAGGLLVTLAVANREVLNVADNYNKPVAAMIVAEQQPGDVVWTPQPSAFWGMAWYLAAPNDESSLTLRPPFREQSKWKKILEWIGPDITGWLQIAPRAQSLMTPNGMPIIIANENQEKVEQAKRVWLVTFVSRNDLPPGVPGDTLGTLQRVKSVRFSPLQLDLYQQRQPQ